MVFPALPTGALTSVPFGADPVQDPYFSQVKAPAAVEVRGFSLSAENATTIGSMSAGAGAGKITFNPLQVEKSVDRLSPSLFTISASGAHFPTVQIFVRRAGGTTSSRPYLGYEFSTVFITKIDWSGGGGDEAPAEQVQFAYAALTLGYYPQQPDGSLGRLVKLGWNVVTEKQTGAETLPGF